MRVLHVIPSIDRFAGGPTAALLGLTRAQVKAGLEVKVLTTYRQIQDRVAGQVFQDQGVAVEMLGPVAGKLARHPDLAFLADQQVKDAHIVHIHAIWEQLLHVSARSAQKRNIPYILTPHGMLDPWSLAQNKWAKKLMMTWRIRRNLDRAAALHFTSNTERDLTAPLKLRAPKIVEPIGLEMADYEHLPPGGTFRQRYPQIGDRPLILFLGRIHPGKGLEHLVPALAQADVPGAMLAVVGPDSENFRGVIEGLVEKHGLKDRVIFTGFLDGVDRLAALSDADLFCLPSDHENFGMSIVEALAAGVPVLISDHVAIWREIVDANVGAATAPETAAVARELHRWLTDAALRKTAAENARSFVWSRYDWDQIARRWRRHYEDILTR
jgi:glycosyltransferase involved in cell wall biosynthesis